MSLSLIPVEIEELLSASRLDKVTAIFLVDGLDDVLVVFVLNLNFSLILSATAVLGYFTILD